MVIGGRHRRLTPWQLQLYDPVNRRHSMPLMVLPPLKSIQ